MIEAILAGSSTKAPVAAYNLEAVRNGALLVKHVELLRVLIPVIGASSSTYIIKPS